MFWFFLSQEIDDTSAPVASSTFIEGDNKGEDDEDSATLLNSLESFLVGEQGPGKTEEEDKEEETKQPNVEGSKQDDAAAKEVTEETKVEDANDSKSRNVVVIDGQEIDIDELLKKDPDEDQYYIDEVYTVSQFTQAFFGHKKTQLKHAKKINFELKTPQLIWRKLRSKMSTLSISEKA